MAQEFRFRAGPDGVVIRQGEDRYDRFRDRVMFPIRSVQGEVIGFGLCDGATALALHGRHFFGYFFPEGAPLWLAPIIIPVEIVSYLSRPVSLSIRLFANMVAGHVMLKVFATFVVLIGSFGALGFLGALLPMATILLAPVSARIHRPARWPGDRRR